MYNLSKLLEDVAAKRGRLQGKEGAASGPSEYAEVWNAFGGYAKACLAERRGLHLPQLCKLGWRIDRKSKGSASVKPFFQLTDQFCRANLSAEAFKKHQQNAVPEKDMCPVEDFNFSKAAIKHSQQLTKDQVFTGLRAIAQQLGEVVAGGSDAEIPIGDVGRLRCSGGGREPGFQFSGEVYAMEGQRPPARANTAPAKEDAPAAAFSRDMPKEALGLGIRGSNNIADTGDVPAMSIDAPPAAAMAKAQEQEAPPPPPAPQARTANTGQQPTTTELKQGFAYKEAMERHVMALEKRAAEAVAEHDAWNQHVSECLEQEREEIVSKRYRAKENLQLLQAQMAQSEEKKKYQRKEDIEAASAHEFPIMQGQAKEESRKQVTTGMQQRLKKELDDQVRTNSTLKNLAKQRERALEIDHLENLRSEMSHLRSAERAKKAYEREALSSAWNSDVRLHNITKAIDNHGKSNSAAALRAPTPAIHAPTLDTLPNRGGTPIGSAGRLMTGSVRRVPMGASNSLGQLETRLSTAGSQRY